MNAERMSFGEFTARFGTRLYNAYTSGKEHAYARANHTFAEFVAAVYNGTEDVVGVSASDHHKCPKCKGTGEFVDAHGTNHGMCFTCAGKGYTTSEDRKRNYYYHQEWRPRQARAQEELARVRETLGIPA